MVTVSVPDLENLTNTILEKNIAKKSELKQTNKDFFKMARFTFLFWLHLGLIDLNSPWLSLSPKYISYTVGAHLEGKESTILISAH